MIPLAVSDLFSSMPGLSGLFIAALSSAALSTLSSSLSSIGAVTYDDIIREEYPNLSEAKASAISKIVVFLYGMLAMAFTGIIAVLPGSIINVSLALMGCVDGQTCAIFIVCMLYKRASTKGLLMGAFAGMTCIIWINMGNLLGTVKTTPTLSPGATFSCGNKTELAANSSRIYSFDSVSFYNASLNESKSNNFTDISALEQIYSISVMLYQWIGCIVTMMVAIPVSLLTTSPEGFDERCLFSFKRHILEEFFVNRQRSRNSSLKMDCENTDSAGNKVSEPLVDETIVT